MEELSLQTVLVEQYLCRPRLPLRPLINTKLVQCQFKRFYLTNLSPRSYQKVLAVKLRPALFEFDGRFRILVQETFVVHLLDVLLTEVPRFNLESRFSPTAQEVPWFQRFLALGELEPKSRAAGDSVSPSVISAPALRERETSGTQGYAGRNQRGNFQDHRIYCEG